MAASTLTHHRWDAVPAEQITPFISRRYVSGDRVTIARFELKKGGVVPRHAHENEQVSYVVSGRLRFDIDGRIVDVAGGELAQIPGGVPHEVAVVEDAVVIDVFSPVRQDWVNGTDTYFGRT